MGNDRGKPFGRKIIMKDKLIEKTKFIYELVKAAIEEK